MSTGTIIFIGVAIYLLVMLTIGVYAAKKAGSATDFIVAGRKIPVWILSATLVATWFWQSCSRRTYPATCWD
jgi:Na+/proline symporter